MANWRRPCSSWRDPADPPSTAARLLLFAILAGAGGCGQAGDRDSTPPDQSADAALCRPAGEGSIEARLQGAIDVELAWGADSDHCLGGVRPGGDGLRLVYKGSVPGHGSLLLVLGTGPIRPGESARNVPVNLTVVREGTGQFFATQGEDKCAFDELRQSPVAAAPGHYRLEGRGFCTQPARAVAGDGAVLMSRFDVVAVVDAQAAATGAATPAGADPAVTTTADGGHPE